MEHLGELAALGVAVSFSLAAVFFEKASKTIGPTVMNFYRIVFTIVLIGLVFLFTKGTVLFDLPTAVQWMYVPLTGLISYVIGDLMLYKAYSMQGAQKTQLTLTLVPITTGVLAYIYLDESMPIYKIIAIVISMTGIAIALMGNKQEEQKKSLTLYALLFSLGSVVSQAVSMVMIKIGLEGYDVLSGVQLAAMFGLIFLSALISIKAKWAEVFLAFKDKAQMKNVFVGSFFGSFIGISLLVYSLKAIPISISSTLSSLDPIFLLVTSAIFLKSKITTMQVVGTIVCIGSAVFFFLNLR